MKKRELDEILKKAAAYAAAVLLIAGAFGGMEVKAAAPNELDMLIDDIWIDENLELDNNDGIAKVIIPKKEEVKLTEAQRQAVLSDQWYGTASKEGAVIAFSNGKAILGTEVNENGGLTLRITQAGKTLGEAKLGWEQGKMSYEAASGLLFGDKGAEQIKLTSVIIEADDGKIKETDPINRPVGSSYDISGIRGVRVNGNEIIPIAISNDGDITILTKTVGCRVLNVRNGAGTSYAKLGQLSRGDKVTVLEVIGGWAKIEYNGGIGYVSVRCLV